MKRLLLGFVVLVVVAVVGLVAATWAPDRSVESLSPRWAQPPSQFVEVDGMRVHLRDEGPREDPTPIVLLHGTSASLHTWDGWAKALASERRVIRFDLPGFGLTGPHPRGDYRIEAYASFVIAVLDSLKVRQVVLAGNSLGGYVAWATAVAAPERVRALVLVDSAGYPSHALSMPIGFRIARNPLLAPLGRRVLPRSIVESSLRNTYGDPSRVTPELVDRYFELTLREGNRDALVVRLAQAPTAAVSSDRVRELHQPTLILWGGRDRLIPPENAERFHKDIAGSQVVLFPELGHVPHEEDPAQTVAAVKEFLHARSNGAPEAAAQP